MATTLSTDEVRHIAKLARLRLTEEEVEKFSQELTSILQYVEMLQEVNTENVEETAQVTGLRSVFREDAPWNAEARENAGGLRPASRGELLACSPLPIVSEQIQTPSAHG
jgi:aspartyl-tRNA(Asn)/glutamyl-tRNA(Gln) amidotransferase subunit C